MDDAAYENLKREYLRETYARGVWMGLNWDGVQFLQYAEDVVALAEAVHQAKADAVVEVGVCAGGGLAFYSSVLAFNPRGLVVGIDVSVGRAQAVASRFPGRVRLVQGDSADPKVVSEVEGLLGDRRAVVVLDGDHTATHVAKELELYSSLVPAGSYLVVMDGGMRDLVGMLPQSAATDNPETAVAAFLPGHPEFQRDSSKNRFGITLAPGGFLRRISDAP